MRPTSSWRNARAARRSASARASSICVNALSASVFDENSGRLPSATASSSSIARRPMPRLTAATHADSSVKFGNAASGRRSTAGVCSGRTVRCIGTTTPSTE